jgi:hypothetical protein
MLSAFMNTEAALKVVLALVGLLFFALAYPMFVFVRQEPVDDAQPLCHARRIHARHRQAAV